MRTINYINEQGQSILFDIIIAANYLHIQGLIDITTMEVARKMVNKTPVQIRELFKLENDLEINDVKLEGWDEEFMSTINYINEQGQSILFDIIIAANSNS